MEKSYKPNFVRIFKIIQNLFNLDFSGNFGNATGKKQKDVKVLIL